MNTPNNNIEDLSFSEMNSAEQREYLQEQNPDMLAMCFSLLSDD
jgi:hypothetical protein